MSEAPERIWAEPGMPGYTDEPNELYTVEYVRADRIEELETENKGLRHMILDQIEGAGDDPEIMAASRAEWAARAKAAEAKLAKARKFVLRFANQTKKIDHIGPEEWPLTELDLSVQRDRDITTARALLAELTG